MRMGIRMRGNVVGTWGHEEGGGGYGVMGRGEGDMGSWGGGRGIWGHGEGGGGYGVMGRGEGDMGRED
jgi:hypothetical protein